MTPDVIADFRRIERTVHEALERSGGPAIDSRHLRLLRSFDLARAIDRLASHAGLDGVEAEVHQECMRRGHLPAHGNSVVVPWSVRSLTVAAAAGGGYLSQTQNLPAADAVRSDMVLGQMGANFINAPMGAAVALPKETGKATSYWLSSETAQITESDQTFGQVSFSPRTVGAYTEISRLLLLQSAARDVVTRDLFAVAARAAEAAALFGTGTAGQPTGLKLAPGLGSFSAASATLATLVDAQSSLGDALNASAGILTTRAVAGSLRKRQEFTNSSLTIWRDSLIAGTCAGLPARSSTAITAGHVFVGSWQYLNIVLWGEGLEVSVNPYDQANFQRGVVGVRCFLSVDSAATWPSAFTLATDFT